jgi:hypothetical protein
VDKFDAMQMFVRVIDTAGIKGKAIGWHSFRRSLAANNNHQIAADILVIKDGILQEHYAPRKSYFISILCGVVQSLTRGLAFCA